MQRASNGKSIAPHGRFLHLMRYDKKLFHH
jgi:hypothetical protein